MDCIVNKTTRFGNLRHPPWHPRCRHFDMMSIAFPDVLQFDLNLYISDVGPSSHRHSLSRLRKIFFPLRLTQLAFLCCCTEEALPARGGRGANDFHCWRVHRCGLRGNILYATSTWFLFKARLAFSLVIVYLGFCMRRPCRVVVADQSLRSICRYHGPRFVQLLVRPGRSELCFLDFFRDAKRKFYQTSFLILGCTLRYCVFRLCGVQNILRINDAW
mmetsp:Transcript_39226/g.75188  ORF Transcript_39226/g.75188 Transcript_39226/m.75188 type:complete len:217 (-) Transcript_39226:171-821(-)